MEAANRGAHQVGGRSIGLGISLPTKSKASINTSQRNFNLNSTISLSVLVRAHGWPGRLPRRPALDELFESLTLVQTKKTAAMPPIVLFGSEFWNEIINFNAIANGARFLPRT